LIESESVDEDEEKDLRVLGDELVILIDALPGLFLSRLVSFPGGRLLIGD